MNMKRLYTGTLMALVHASLLVSCGGGSGDDTPTTPEITLSPRVLSFHWTDSGTPPEQVVNVASSGSGTFAPLQASIDYASGQPSGWLSATLDATTVPTRLIVSPLPGTLANGHYDASIVVSCPAASRSLAVSLEMERGPAIALGSSSLSFQSQGTTGAPPAQTVAITNAGGGTLTGLQTSVSYGAGEPSGWLSANLSSGTAPATLTLQVTPGTIEAGTYQAVVTVTAVSAPQGPQAVTVSWTHTMAAGPVLGTPSVGSSQVTLSWTFTWPPPFASSNDQYWLEESTTGPFSGFTLIATYPQASAHQSSFTTPPLSRPTAGTYWYRVRAYTWQGWTAFSNVQSATVSSVTATRFQNNSAWSIVSLRVDGIEQFPTPGTGIPPGYYYQLPLAPGMHTLAALSGTWNPDGTRFQMYSFNGSFNQPAGSIWTVNLNNPSIADLLTRFYSSGRWTGEYWQNLTLHFRTFQFLSNGTFKLYDDGIQIQWGTYQLVRYTAGVVIFSVRYVTGETFEGTLNEIEGVFLMRNGVSGWPTLQYTYQGH